MCVTVQCVGQSQICLTPDMSDKSRYVRPKSQICPTNPRYVRQNSQICPTRADVSDQKARYIQLIQHGAVLSVSPWPFDFENGLRRAHTMGYLSSNFGLPGSFLYCARGQKCRTDRQTHKAYGRCHGNEITHAIGERCLYHLPNMNLIGQRGPELWRNLLNFYHYL